MSGPLKITATVGAYLPHHADVNELHDAISDPERHPALVSVGLLAYACQDMSTMWTRVGDAEITITINSRDELVRAAVAALNGQLESARADFVRLQTDILDRIGKLQALEYSGSAA